MITYVNEEAEIREYYLNRGYKFIENQQLLPQNDPTIFLINSTVALFKNQMNQGVSIEDTSLIQDCFRNNSDVNSLIPLYFKMFGHIGMKTSLHTILEDIISLFEKRFGMKKENLWCYVSSKDQDLIECWIKVGNPSTLVHMNEEKPEYATVWKYGDGYSLTGRGMTIVYRDVRQEKIRPKGISLGNIIVVKNEMTGMEYVETGFGYDRLLSFRHKNDVFQIPRNRRMIEKIEGLGISIEDAKVLSLLLKAVFKLLDEGICLGNKKDAYLLKTTMKKLILKLMDLEKYKKENISSMYERIYQSIQGQETFFKHSHHQLILAEVKRFIANLDTLEKSAVKLIRKNKSSCERKRLKQQIIESFGLTSEHTEKLLQIYF